MELVRCFKILGLANEGGSPSAALAGLVAAQASGGYPAALGELLAGTHAGLRSARGWEPAGMAEAAAALPRAFPGTARAVGRHLAFLAGASAVAGIPVADELLRATKTHRPPGPPPGLMAAKTGRDAGAPPSRGRWDPIEAAHVLVDRVFDPDMMPAGSPEERAFLVVQGAPKRMGAR